MRWLASQSLLRGMFLAGTRIDVEMVGIRGGWKEVLFCGRRKTSKF